MVKPSEAHRRLALLSAWSPAKHDCFPFFGEMGFLHGQMCMVRHPPPSAAASRRHPSPARLEPVAARRRPLFSPGRGLAPVRRQASVIVYSANARVVYMTRVIFHNVIRLMPDFERRLSDIAEHRKKFNTNSLNRVGALVDEEVRHAVHFDAAAEALASVERERSKRQSKLFGTR